MRRVSSLRVLILLFLIAPASFAATSQADPRPESDATSLSWGAGLDWNQRYLWRGIALSEGGVWNPSLWVSRGPITISGWANIDPETEQPLNEWDLTVEAEGNWGGLSLTPALALYAFPSGAPPTGELLLEVAHVRGPFSTFARQAVEVGAEPLAAWSELGLAVERELHPAVTASGSARFGRGWWRFASAYADPALEGLNVVGFDAELAWSLAKEWTLRPHVAWNQVGNRSVRATLSGSSPFSGGVALEWSR